MYLAVRPTSVCSTLDRVTHFRLREKSPMYDELRDQFATAAIRDHGAQIHAAVEAASPTCGLPATTGAIISPDMRVKTESTSPAGAAPTTPPLSMRGPGRS